MTKTRIAIEVQIELDGADPTAMLRPLLRALADRVAGATTPLQSAGEARATEGSVRWRVQSWDQGDLTVCVGCGREVPRSETDITESGERCRTCVLGNQVDEHWTNVERQAQDRGREEGSALASLVDALWDDD